MNIAVPELSLVVLIGAPGSGKSTFARKHFKPTEILSSDFCRALVSDDESDQSASKDAFEVLHFIVAKRLHARRLTVVNATNAMARDRKPLLELARKYNAVPVAVVFDLPERLCQERNSARPNRCVPPDVVSRQSERIDCSLPSLRHEGFRHVFVFNTPQEVDAAVVEIRVHQRESASDTFQLDFDRPE